MIFRSIRFRLTLWYCAAFSLSLAVILTSVYFITKQTLFSQTDSTIANHCNQIIQVFQSSSEQMLSSAPKQLFLREFAEMPGMLLLVTDSNGRIITSSQPEEIQNQTISDLIEKSIQIISPAFVDRRVGTSNLRLGIFPVKKGNNSLGLVIVGHPIDVILVSLNRLVTLLIIVYFGFLIIETLGLYLLSRRALAPVRELSGRLKKIRLENLNEKINSPKTGDEVEELIESFNNLMGRLNDTFSRERQFIGDVAHELKTPLSIIKSNNEVALTKDRDTEEYQRILNETVLDINKLSAMLNNILDLAWSEATPPKKITDAVNFSDLLEELSEVATEMAGVKEIKVRTDVEKNVSITAKKDKIFRAFLNILENAVKYTPSGGSISITLTRMGSLAVCEICDSGIGIEEADLPHVFERFYRGSSSSKVQGSGLGLAIARAIITQHRGSISVVSQKNNGTRFIAKLPISESS